MVDEMIMVERTSDCRSDSKAGEKVCCCYLDEERGGSRPYPLLNGVQVSGHYKIGNCSEIILIVSGNYTIGNSYGNIVCRHNSIRNSPEIIKTFNYSFGRYTIGK